ncbi:MAG: polysaccharide deacetylase family protein [Chloroflexota bacterium]
MSQTNRLLGYPDDARLLILNADDFGMYQAINTAIQRTLKEGVVCSASLMVPWPGAPDAMTWLAQNPDVSFSVHLSIICDIDTYRQRPLTPADKVPSLVDESGYFYTLDHMDELLARASPDELETEFRAQIETVFDTGLRPTHVDWHCLHNGGRAAIFDLTLRLAKEYGLALRVSGQPYTEQVQRQGLPSPDYELLDSFGVDITRKSAIYTQMLRDLPPGLTEWAVHPGLGDAESQAIDPGGWQVRQTDFDFLMSPEASDRIRQEGIILLDYKPLQKLWQSKSQPA